MAEMSSAFAMWADAISTARKTSFDASHPISPYMPSDDGGEGTAWRAVVTRPRLVVGSMATPGCACDPGVTVRDGCSAPIMGNEGMATAVNLGGVTGSLEVLIECVATATCSCKCSAGSAAVSIVGRPRQGLVGILRVCILPGTNAPGT